MINTVLQQTHDLSTDSLSPMVNPLETFGTYVTSKKGKAVINAFILFIHFYSICHTFPVL